MASIGAGVQLRRMQLKKDVCRLLSNHPNGVEKNKLWNVLRTELGRLVCAKDYCLRKMNDILMAWDDEIEEYGNPKHPLLRLRQQSGDGANLGAERPLKPDTCNREMFPILEGLKLGENKSNSEKVENKHSSEQEQEYNNFLSLAGTSVSAAQNMTETQTAKTVGYQSFAKATGKKSAVESSIIFNVELKRTIVEEFSKIGPTSSIKLSVLWKQVCNQLGEIPKHVFKAKLETFKDFLEVDAPTGLEAEESYRLQDYTITSLSQQIPVSKVFNLHSTFHAGPLPDDVHNQSQMDYNKPDLSEKDAALLRPALLDLLLDLPSGLNYSAIRKMALSNFGVKLSEDHLNKHFSDMLEKTGKSYKLKLQKELTKNATNGNSEGEDDDDVVAEGPKIDVEWQDKGRIAALREAVVNILKPFPGGKKWGSLSKLLSEQIDTHKLKKKVVCHLCNDIIEQIGKTYVLKLPVGSSCVGAASSDKVDKVVKFRQLDDNKVAKLKEGLLTILEKYHPTGITYHKIRHELNVYFKLYVREDQMLQYFSDILVKVGDFYNLKRQIEPEKQTDMGTLREKPTAMDLMSVASGWGQPAGAARKEKSSENVIDLTNETSASVVQQKQVLKQDFISFNTDSSETIDLTDDNTSVSEIPQNRQNLNAQSYYGTGSMPASLLGPGPSSLLQQRPSLILGQSIPTGLPVFSPGPVPQGSQITAMDCTPATNKSHKIPFYGKDSEGFDAGFWNVVVDLTVEPIVKKEFETKEIITQPVFLPRGQRPSADMVETIAKECIEVLANANEYVSPERVEKLLCQRFGVYNVRPLGFMYPDRIGCINEMYRITNKINSYIYTFVKTRSICTLFELRECLREFVPNNEDFSNLKLGPLQRFPVVWEQFRFPPNQEIIPEIKSPDIIEHFRNYLCKKNKWASRLELEDFMNYLVEIYSADNAYYLGVRIRSLPLAAQVCSHVLIG